MFTFEFDRLRTGTLGILGAFKAALGLLFKNILHFIIPVIAQLVSQIALASLTIDVLVNRRSSTVREERFVIQVVIFVITETMA